MYTDIWEEIKHRVSLVSEMEKRGIDLRLSGSGSMMCLCPFHADGTPSCHVTTNREVEMFHCFGCHKSGTVIDFVMGIDNLGLVDALRYFKTGHALEHASDVDLSKLIEREDTRRKPSAISSHALVISWHVQDFISRSPDPVMDMQKLKPFLILADEATYLESVEYLKVAEAKIKRQIKDIEEIRRRMGSADDTV